ncbi:MAG: hypothetical protein ACI8TQ_003615 [Planctomycetota bacterium]
MPETTSTAFPVQAELKFLKENLIVDSSQAQSILVQAREILSNRLIELIIESKEAFLDDAHGNSYMDEIGSVYDQVMGRLTQINSMIANLPSSTPLPTAAPASSSGSGAPKENATFQTFVQRVSTGDTKSAAPMLATLLNLEATLAKSCTETYSERLAAYPDTLQRTLQLRVDVAQDHDNQVIMFLYECFGLSSVDAIGVLNHLKQSFGQAA